eukprot:3926280-Prymnesium_polylepis.1
MGERSAPSKVVGSEYMWAGLEQKSTSDLELLVDGRASLSSTAVGQHAPSGRGCQHGSPCPISRSGASRVASVPPRRSASKRPGRCHQRIPSR